MTRAFLLLILATAAPTVFGAQTWTTYVGALSAQSVVLAWGKPGLGNVIGRDANSYGNARVTVGRQRVETDRAWALVEGLEPDTRYSYTIEIGGETIGKGSVRTWARAATRLSFLVIGDFGTGSSDQALIGAAMAKVVDDRANTPNPIRFVLTTGDNIYGTFLIRNDSGDRDIDWWPRLYVPFAGVLSQVPMYPSLGNHDGNESEKRGDLPVYLDNFFFPNLKPARWYEFGYGSGFADFFALDSTRNSETGPHRPVYLEDGEQTVWLKSQLAQSKAVWKIPYFHHPLFNAGPYHESPKAELRLKHWQPLFSGAGVKVVFQGHEHNYQVSYANEATSGIRFFITGAGGELRRGDVRGNMAASQIEAWAAVRHFLLVDIEDKTMTVEPRSYEAVRMILKDGTNAQPVKISLP